MNKKICLSLLFCLVTLTYSYCQKTSVYFKLNDYSIDKSAKITIDSILRIKNIGKICLKGFCDSTGSNDFNDDLSLKRVVAVKEYLVLNNVAENIIETKALGKRVLLNKNMTEKERALNRRVEIEITTQPIASTSVEVLINGIVLDEKNRPIKAEVSLSDKKGKEILATVSGKDGKYKLNAMLNKKDDYSLTYYNDSSFIASQTINYSKQNLPFNNLKTVLPILKGGKKYVLQNLNFEGDTSKLIAASFSSLEALYKLMKKNKSLVIRIEGHVNQPFYHVGYEKEIAKSPLKRYIPHGMTNEQFGQWLSGERAMTIYNYLKKKGIETSRISTIGYGSSKMLFPKPKSEAEMTQNRRVEINVISFE